MTQKYATVEGSYMPIGNIESGTLPPGTFHYLIDGPANTVDAIEYVCPCGCNAVCILPFIEGFATPALFTWNGDEERPTIDQAIHDIGDETGPHWRGRLTDGVFVGANKHDA